MTDYSALNAAADQIAAEKVAAQKAIDDAALVAQRNADAAALASQRTADAAALAAEQARTASVQAAFDAYVLANHPVTQPPPVDPPPTSGKTVIGMSAPASQWSARLSEVGATGITARRIYAFLDNSFDQFDLIDAAFGAKMMPVVSWKVNDVAGAKSGKYDAEAQRVAQRIAAAGKPARVGFWHEPSPDIPAADFETLFLRYCAIFQAAGLKFGFFMNGWLLDRQADTTFASYVSAKVLAACDWVGIDTYESGTMSNPGVAKPADRIPLLVKFLAKRGVTKPIGIGEYNGYSALTITAAGEAILSEPKVEFACMWNNTAGKGSTLSGDRLAAFRATLADPRTTK